MRASSNQPTPFDLALYIHHVVLTAAMRLLRVGENLALQFEEFYDGDVPPYAILSHTWGVGEVLYEDMFDGSAQRKNGFAKIMGCAEKARSHDLHYIWVDTCCKDRVPGKSIRCSINGALGIDKRSSAELTEAINSMYQWYQKSEECYVYFSDVPDKHWTQSRWFTRGWTLQVWTTYN